MELFGFNISRPSKNSKKDSGENVTTPGKFPTFVSPSGDDAIVVSEGGVMGQYVDLDGASKSEVELITRYRDMAIQPEIEIAIDDIINEFIISHEKNQPVGLILDGSKLGDKTKKSISAEFDYLLNLLNFKTRGYDIVKRWYIDGRVYYHKVVDTANLKTGIKELKYIDPRKIKKIIQQKAKRVNGVDVFEEGQSFFMYNDKGFGKTFGGPSGSSSASGVKISLDAIAYVNSGVYDYKFGLILSYLHKAIKPFNQLRMLEDAVVVYRLARAPERRIFYIDVGNLPKIKAEQHLRELMIKHKNRLVYDATTGEVKDDRKFTTMLEDYWLPRREGGRGTEITTLPGGQNLGQMDDVDYFRKKLLKSLNVPASRIEDTQFTLGRATEISRDEVKFSKFISKLRARFDELFNDLLKTQLVLKKIITLEEWEELRTQIRYNWINDTYFSELKDNEIFTERVTQLNNLTPFIGKFFSEKWVKKNILRLDDDEIESMQEEMDEEEEKNTEKAANAIAATPDQGAIDQSQDQGQIPPNQNVKSESKNLQSKESSTNKEDTELSYEDRKLIEDVSDMLDKVSRADLQS